MPPSTSPSSEKGGRQWLAGRSFLSSIRRDRGVAVVIAVFVLLVATMVGYTARGIGNERETAVIVTVTTRQRALVERYIKDVLLVLDGVQADPEQSADALVQVADALLDGGTVTGLQGSLDATVEIPAVHGESARVKLEAARDRIAELVATGRRITAARPAKASEADIRALRVLAAQLSSLTSDAAGAVTDDARGNLDRLVSISLGLGAASIVAALAMGLFLRRTGERQSARFRSLVHNATDLIAVVSADTTLVYQSPSAATVLGRAPADVTGRPVAEFVHPDDRHLLDAAFAVAPGDTAPVRVRLLRVDGTWRSAEGSVTNLLDDRAVRGLVVNLRDVTERDEAATELAAARDAAMSASVMKSQFLASMSHEVRTPMNAVIGLSELLLGTELDADQREYASGVHSAGEGLLTIINDILDFSKVEAGWVQLDLVDVDVALLAEEVVALLGETANAKGIELLVHASPAVPAALRADPTRLRQIIVNLVSNAVKFTAAGEVVVRLRPDDAPAPPGRVAMRFEVHDTGIGIPEGVKSTIFEPFSQADASTTRRFGGTGLGLAIVRQLVEVMGGEIGVESTAGEGSTFWLVIPFEQSSAAVVEARTLELDALTGARALVVDDNATNRLVCCEQLTSWGVEVHEVPDGPSAILEAQRAAVHGEPYTFAVLDLNMPELDGLEVADELRNNTSTAAIRLFVLSSSGRLPRETIAEHRLAGTLTKPVRRSDLYNCLVDGLAETPGSPPAPTAGRPPVSAQHVAALGPSAPVFRGRVLLVEDNATNRLVAGSMLSRLGLDVDHAGDGVEALEILRTRQERGEPYVAVFMDCQMPRMDGYEATRRIRVDESGNRHVPIIAMTAAAMEGDREACLAAGMDDYVSKPIRPDALQSALARCAPGAVRDDAGDAAAAGPGAADVGADGELDLARIELLRSLDLGEGESLETLVQQYLSDADERVERLKEYLTAGDLAQVGPIAHALRGASANVGARLVAELCARIEHRIQADDRDGVVVDIDLVDEAVHRVRPELEEVAARPPSAP